MLFCDHCSFTISPAHDARCPRCGQPTPKQQPSGWVAVARVNNLAEVGYLADLLEGEGIATQVVQHNDFCAVSGAWNALFLLRVAAENRAAAVSRLQEDLHQGAEDSAWGGDEYSQRRGIPFSAWRSMVLVLMAGGIAYYAGRGGLEPPRRPAPLRESLWEALTESEQTYVAEPRQDTAARRLHVDRRTRTIVLEEGADEEGRMRVRRFQHGRLVEETVRRE